MPLRHPRPTTQNTSARVETSAISKNLAPTHPHVDYQLVTALFPKAEKRESTKVQNIISRVFTLSNFESIHKNSSRFYKKCENVYTKCTSVYIKSTRLYIKCSSVYNNCSNVNKKCESIYKKSISVNKKSSRLKILS